MRLHHRYAALLALVLAAPLSAAEALAPSDFALRLPLSVHHPDDGLHLLELPERAYQAATARNLADLRIFNANGEALPWAPLPVPPSPPVAGASVDLALVPLPAQPDLRAAVLQSIAVRVERDAQRTVVEVAPVQPPGPPPADVGGYLIDARSLRDRSGQLELVFDAAAPEFAGRVEVVGSDDLVSWRPVTSGPLALNRSLGVPVERRTFDLVHPPPFLRLQWPLSQRAPQLAAARFSERTAAAPNTARTALTVLADPEAPGSFLVDVPRALPIERLHFRPQSMNESFRVKVFRLEGEAQRPRRHFASRHRPGPWIEVGEVEVTRLMRSGAEVVGAPLAFPWTAERLRLVPVGPSTGQVPRVEAEWRAGRIVFLARRPGPYFLAVGRAGAPAGPAPDLQTALTDADRVAPQLPAAEVAPGSADATVSAAEVRRRAQRITDQAHWSRFVLWGVLLVAVAAMAWMAWRLSLQLRPDGEP